MRRSKERAFSLAAALIALGFAPRGAWACAACYGQSNSAMAEGMNWGIATLLCTIVLVLGAVASFFVFLARRAAAHPVQAAEPASSLLYSNDDHFAPGLPALRERTESPLPGQKPFRRRCPVGTTETVAGNRFAGGRPV